MSASWGAWWGVLDGTEGLASNPLSLQMDSSGCVSRGFCLRLPTWVLSLLSQASSPAAGVLPWGLHHTAPTDPVGVGSPAQALLTPTWVRLGTWKGDLWTEGEVSAPELDCWAGR